MRFSKFDDIDWEKQIKPKVFKWLAIILGSLLVIVLAVVLFVHFYFTAELLTSWIAPPLEHYLHRDVILADAGVGFRGLRVEGLEIRKPGATVPLLKGERLDLRWKFTELLKGRVVIHTLAFTNPEVTIVRQQDGSLSIADLLPEKTSSETTANSFKNAGGDHGGVPLLLSLLSMENGRLTYVDSSLQPQAKVTVSNIRSRLMDFSAAAPMPFEFEGQIEGSEERSVAIRGTYHLDKSAFNGDVNLQNIDLKKLAPFIVRDHADLIQQGKMNIEAALATKGFDHFKGKGALTLSDLKIKKEEKLSKVLQVNADFQLDGVNSQQNLKIAALDLSLNGQKAKIQGILTQWRQRPHLDFTLSSPQIKLDELLALFPKRPPPVKKTESASKQAPLNNELPTKEEVQKPEDESTTSSAPKEPLEQPKQAADNSKASPEPEATPEQAGKTAYARAEPASKTSDQPASSDSESAPKSFAFDAQGEIHLDWFLYNKLVVSNVDCQLTFRDGKLQLEPLSASLYGGALGGRVKGDVESAGPPFQSNVYTENIILDEVIAVFWPTTTEHWSGNVNLISRASGNGSDLSSLESRTDLNINEAEFYGHPLFLRFADLFQVEELQKLRFSQVTARILTNEGVATIKRLHLVGPVVQAEGTGTAGLLDKKLDLRLLLQIRAQYVGKIVPLRDIVTKITDKHGFVQLPLTITGTIDEPVYGLDQSWLKKTAKRLGVKQVKKVGKKKPAKPTHSQLQQKQLKEGLGKLSQ